MSLYTQPGITPNFNRHPHTAPLLIGLSGYAGSGKDTVGTIINALYNHERLSFAAPLKEALYRLNPWAAFPATDKVDVRTLVDEIGWDEAKKVNDKDPHGIRGLLQRLGTEVGREMFGEDFWVDQAFKNVRQGKGYVFTDTRFPNEALAIVESGGVVLRVERPGFEPVNPHPSETALDDWNFDAVIENDGTVLDLQGEVLTVLGAFDA